MCSNLLVHGAPLKVLTTQREVAALVGLHNLVVEGGYSPQSCLCPVDLEATAKNAGFECSTIDEDGAPDPFDFHWRPTS